MKLIQRILLGATLLMGLNFALGVSVASVSAQSSSPIVGALFNSSKNDACKAVGGCGGGAGTLNRAVRAIINLLSVIIGIVAVVMIIYNGFRFITSGGDSNAVSSAKNGILYAVIGLIIVALAQVIVRFVLSKV